MNDLSIVDLIFTFADFDTVKISSTITSKGVRLNVTKTVDLLRRQNIRAYLVEY